MDQATALIEQHRPRIQALCDLAFGAGVTTVAEATDINRGRGAFSEVLRVGLIWNRPDDDDTAAERPAWVVAKLPVDGPNGAAARASGAYDRESLAYREILDHSPIDHPRAYAVIGAEPGTDCELLLEDLTGHRFADQLDGLDSADAVAVGAALAGFHRAWAHSQRLGTLPVRRNTLAALDQTALTIGLDVIADRWADVLDDTGRRVFAELVAAAPALVERFAAAPPTLCHGDPRADNLVFAETDGRPILFDWQQMAIQLAEADLAWLAATSLTVEVRREVEVDLVDAADGDLDRYRLGLALPGLAVLMLAQRDLPTERGRRFVAVSLQRIAAALADNETARLG